MEKQKQSIDIPSKSFDYTEKDAIDAPVKDIQWEGHDLSVTSDPLHDDGTGKNVIVRFFFFKATPELKNKKTRPSKMEIVSSFKMLIEMTLWGDGLIPLEDSPIGVYTRKELKKNALKDKMTALGSDFCIILSATPRLGVSVLETAQTI